MMRRAFGRTGMQVARIGQGTFLMEHAERSTAVRALRHQIFYHLGERTSERGVIAYCDANDIAVVAYTPYGRSALPPPCGAETFKRVARERGTTTHAVALARFRAVRRVQAWPGSELRICMTARTQVGLTGGRPGVVSGLVDC